MDWIAVILILLYILGTQVAYSFLLDLYEGGEDKDMDTHSLYAMSLFSWALFPLWTLLWFITKLNEKR